MKAILVKYLPATNTKPTRLKAYDSDGNYAIWPANSCTCRGGCFCTDTELAKRVAVQLCYKMFWDKESWWDKYELIGGGIKDGYAFVFCPKGGTK